MKRTENLFLSPDVKFVDRSVLDNVSFSMPDSWRVLAERGSHDDLVLRARIFMAFAKEEGFETEACRILSVLGNNFLNPSFDVQKFKPTQDDPDFELKTKFLAAMSQLVAEFGDRIPQSTWESIACLGTRPNPKNEATIFSQQKYLLHPWWLIDANLHAICKPYMLFLHVQSRINEQTGLVLNHNCDCNHSFTGVPGTCTVRAFLPKSQIMEATAAFFTHLLIELYVIGIQGLPTVFGLSPEGAELKLELESLA